MFDETISNIRAKAESETAAITKELVEGLNTSFKEFASKISELEEDADKKHRAILEIHGLVGRDGVIGGFQCSAVDEAKAAKTWRRIAIAFFIAAAIWLAVKIWYGFGITQAGGMNWPELATSVSLTLVLIAAGGYAAAQSKIHRAAEESLRWFALEVSAFDPFIASLSDEDRRELKKQLSERLFGKDRTTSANASTKGGAVTVPDASSLISQLMALVKQIKG